MKFEIKGNYFNNSFQLSPTSGPNSVDKIIKRTCPADLGTLLWEMPVEYRHIDQIIDSSVRGFNYWRDTSIDTRIEYLRKYQEQLLVRQDDIANAIALETGKPLWEAKIEASAVIGKVSVTIEDALPRIQTKNFPEIMPNTTGHIYYKPIGPCLVIGPFNIPCHLANTQILSALAAGNSIIFKPSEKTAYSAQLLIECFHQAGFPKGVINLLQGDGESATRLVKDKAIKGIFFTGSKEVGLKIVKNTYMDLTKLVSLELGGKNVVIVHSDANIDHALAELIKSSFLSAGQRCTSTAIIAIHDSIKDEFINKFHALSKKIIIDHPIEYEREPFMGPLIDQHAVNNYLNFMGMAKREGIEEIMRGKQLERKTPGYYVSPSIHYSSSFDKNSHFLTSEIFGPNCTFISYKEIEQAIQIANSTEYGLTSAVFTADRTLYDLCVKDVTCGIINLNRSTTGASPKLPFGGVKNSGNYRPASIATIDACVYQMVGLDISYEIVESIEDVKGLDL